MPRNRFDQIMAEWNALRIQLQGRSGATQLAYSSFDSGQGHSIDEIDPVTGLPVASYGTQFDGSHGSQVFAGPIPPTPTRALVAVAPSVLTGGWDGYFVDEDGQKDETVYPTMDFTHVEVHASKMPGFSAEFADTLIGTVHTARGGMTATAISPGTWYVRLVSRSAAGKRSAASPAVMVEVPQTVDVGPIREELEQASTLIEQAGAAAAAAMAEAEAARGQAGQAYVLAIDAGTGVSAAMTEAEAARAEAGQAYFLADDAADAAAAAQGTATTAKNTADSAAGTAATAQSAAGAAVQQASAAVTGAAQALSQAGQAYTLAETAEGAATAAQGTAQTAAQTAAGAVSTAATAAGLAQQLMTRGQSLLRNGNMDDGPDAPGWVLKPGATIIPEAARSGTHGMRINATEETGAVWPQNDWIRTSTGRTYYAEMWVRRTGTDTWSTYGIGMIAQTRDKDGAWATPVIWPTGLGAELPAGDIPTDRFVRVSFEIVVEQPDAVTIAFAPWFYQNATNFYDIDDMLVVDVTEATAAAATADAAAASAATATGAAAAAQSTATAAQSAAGTAGTTATAAAALAQQVFASGNSLIRNGHMNDGPTAPGWTLKNGSSIIAAAARSGTHGMRINATDATGAVWPLSEFVPTSQGRSYYVEFWIRRIGTDTTSYNKIQLVAHSVDKNGGSSVPLMWPPGGALVVGSIPTNGFIRVAFEYTNNQTDAVKVAFGPYISAGANSYDIDDFIVIDTTEAKAAQAAAAAAQTTATGAQTAAGAAQTTAAGAATAAGTAQSTATAAQTAAGTAKTTADNAATAAGAAQTTANNAVTAAAAAAKKITVSESLPTGTSNPGDVWWRKNSNGAIIGQWEWATTPTPAGWKVRTTDGGVITNMAIGNLVAGSGTMAQGVIDKIFADVVVAKTSVTTTAFIGETAILTGAVTATKITASEELTAKVAQFLEVNADMVNTNALWADAAWIAAARTHVLTVLQNTNGAGYTSTITGQGLKVTRTVGSDTYDVIRLGTFGEDFLSISDGLGNAKAAISGRGDIGANTVYAQGDIYSEGALISDLTALPKGEVTFGGHFYASPNVPSAWSTTSTTGAGLIELSFDAERGRVYRLVGNFKHWITVNGPERLAIQAFYKRGGTSPTINVNDGKILGSWNNGFSGLETSDIPRLGVGQTESFDARFVPFPFSGAGVGQQKTTCRIVFVVKRLGITSGSVVHVDWIEASVIDMGMQRAYIPFSGQNNGLGTSSTLPAVTQYNYSWPATAAGLRVFRRLTSNPNFSWTYVPTITDRVMQGAHPDGYTYISFLDFPTPTPQLKAELVSNHNILDIQSLSVEMKPNFINGMGTVQIGLCQYGIAAGTTIIASANPPTSDSWYPSTQQYVGAWPTGQQRLLKYSSHWIAQMRAENKYLYFGAAIPDDSKADPAYAVSIPLSSIYARMSYRKRA